MKRLVVDNDVLEKLTLHLDNFLSSPQFLNRLDKFSTSPHSPQLLLLILYQNLLKITIKNRGMQVNLV